MSTHYAIGIDAGTSSVKVSLLGTDGTSETVRSANYPTQRPADAFHEQDPLDWWRATGQALGTLLERHPDLRADNSVIGLTGQMHTTVLRDAAGDVVRPAILWSDRRAAALCAGTDPADFIMRTGNPLLPAFTLAHLMWLRQNEPESLDRTHEILQPKDYLRRLFGAGLATEPSDASGTAMMDTRTDQWDLDLLALAGVRLEQLPPILRSSRVTGVVENLPPGPAELSRLLGTAVVGGAGDQAALAVALDVTVAGRLGISLGTSGAVVGAVGQPRANTFRHAIPGTWLALDSMHSAGLALSWWAQVTGTSVESLVDELPDPDRSLPLFLPYLQGHRSQDGPPGAFLELGAHHDRAALTQSILDGTSLELSRLASAVGHGQPSEEVVRVGGGGGRSPAWRRALAGALGRAVRYTDRDAAHGAAMVAARETVWHDELRQVPKDTVLTEPAPAQIRRFTLLRDRFDKAVTKLT